MESIFQHKLAISITWHMLWGLSLRLSISKYGLGISTDSVHLLFGGLNLADGRGLFSFDGSFLALWPPLYSMLLAGIHLIFGSDVFTAANLLQAASFLGLSACLSVLFIKIFPDSFPLALAANILSDVGVVVLTTFDTVGSDYIHLFLAILFVLLAGYYIESKSPRVLLAMSMIGTLAMFDRYLGVASIATGVALVFFYTEDWRERILRSALMSLSALPAGIWLWVTSPLVARRAPNSFLDNFFWFSKSIVEWFLPENAVEASQTIYTICLWLIVGALIFLLFKFSARYQTFSSFRLPVFVYGLFYWLALFGSASIAYYNKLGGRFLLPLYIPFITLLVISADVLLRLAGEISSQVWRRVARFCIIGLLTLIIFILSGQTLSTILESRDIGAAGENAFNTQGWHENRAMRYWLKHVPKEDYLLFSNYPDGVAFFTWHSVFGSPRRYAGPYSTDEIPPEQYVSELFSSGMRVYIVWIEPNIYSHYYPVDELSSIAEIDTLYQSKDGGVYRLSPKSAP